MSFENKTIAPGVTSEYARMVQRVFRETVDTAIVVDGVIGSATMGAMRSFAKFIGEDPKLGYTENMCKLVDQYIDKRFAKEETYRAIAAKLGCPYNHLRAVCEVESNGSAFLPDGSAVILFERHKFYQKLREVVADPTTLKAVARDADVTATTVDQLMNAVSAKYPNICSTTRGGYLGGVAEYKRLGQATAIHIEAGYWSASYGAFQIMGFNCKLAGYKTATDMMLDFNRSEEAQLNGLMKFIEAQPAMHKALKEGDWATFARLYNGVDFQANRYDSKLAASAARWKKYN